MPVQVVPREQALRFEIAGLGSGAVAVYCRALCGRLEMPLRIEVAELEEGRGVTRVRRLPDQRRGAGKVLADIFPARVEDAERGLSLRVAGCGRPT